MTNNATTETTEQEKAAALRELKTVLSDLFIPFRGLVPETETRERALIEELSVLQRARKHKHHPVARWDAFAAMEMAEVIVASQADAIDEWKALPDSQETFERMRRERVQAALSTTPAAEQPDSFFKQPHTDFKTLGDITGKLFTPYIGTIPGTEERLAELERQSAILRETIPPSTATDDEKNAYMLKAAKMLNRLQALCLEQVEHIKEQQEAVIKSVMTGDPPLVS